MSAIEARWGYRVLHHARLWLWVLAFARTTVVSVGRAEAYRSIAVRSENDVISSLVVADPEK